MSKRLLRILPLLPLAVMLAAFPRTAEAAIADDSGEVEVFVGWLWPDEEDNSDDDELDDVTGGVRLGYNWTPRFGIQGSVQGWQADGGSSDADLEAWFIDLAAVWNVNPDNRATVIIYGGPGWSTWDLEDEDSRLDDDHFTVHVGVGCRAQVTPRFYVRPNAQAHWIKVDNDKDDDDDEDNLTWELTVGFGWVLGPTL
jgi:hypothetical protein